MGYTRTTTKGDHATLHQDGGSDQIITELDGRAIGLTTRGDLVYADGANALGRLAVGTSGQYLKSNGTDPAWDTISQHTFDFLYSMLTGGTGGNDLLQNTTQYCSISGQQAPDATEADVYIVVPCAGTIDNLYVELGGASGSGESHAFTVRKNGADTALTVTISGATDTTGNDTGNSFTVAAGDKLSLKVVSSTAANTVRAYWGVRLEV
jgi:hypothetical protein